MTAVDDYRTKANEFMAKALRETDPTLRVQYETLGQSYLRLADQAERNSRSDIVYETPATTARLPEEPNPTAKAKG